MSRQVQTGEKYLLCVCARASVLSDKGLLLVSRTYKELQLKEKDALNFLKNAQRTNYRYFPKGDRGTAIKRCFNVNGLQENEN